MSHRTVQRIHAHTGDLRIARGVDWWRWTLIAMATLILCSCQAPVIRHHRPHKLHAHRDVDYGPPAGGPSRPAVVAHGRHVQPVITAHPPLPSPVIVYDQGFQVIVRADEYVCDGGDHWGSVRLDQEGKVHGLDPEDTVVQYVEPDGRVRFEHSNRVCLYAPRLAAVRKVTSLDTADDALAARLAGRRVAPDLAGRPVPSLAVHRGLPARGHSQLGVPTPFRDRQLGMELMNRQPLREFANYFAPHEDFQIVRMGVLNQAEQAQMFEFLDAVTTWTDNLAVQVVLDGQEVPAIKSVVPVGEIYQIAEEGAPKLRIIKLASRSEAQPGELVEFTLRFDNLGRRPAQQVAIMDSLPGRLEYVPDSAQSSLPAEFFTQPNDAGSSVLRWDLQQPLLPGQGGILRFTCRVR